MPFDSAHLKNVKHGLANSALNMLSRDGKKFYQPNLEAAPCRLPEFGPLPICETLLQNIKQRQPRDPKEAMEKCKPLFVPYLHGTTHNIKKMGVRIVCSAPDKGYAMCRHVNMKANRSTTDHRTMYTACEQGKGRFIGYHYHVVKATLASPADVSTTESESMQPP